MQLMTPKILILLGLGLGLQSGIALSSTSFARAEIDWSTFTISTFALGNQPLPSYSLNGQSSSANSFISNWLTWGAATSNSGSLFSASTEGTGQGNGSASIQRNATISVSGSGFLAITANYSLGAAINGIQVCDWYCYSSNTADALVSFNLSNNSTTGGSHSSYAKQEISLGNNYWWNGLTSDGRTGQLAVGVIVNEGDVLNFTSLVSASANEIAPYFYIGNVAPVPVPSAIWLFASGLLGAMGLSRSRKAV